MAVQDIFDGIIDFNKDKVVESVKAEIASGTDISVILNGGLIAALDEIGKRFSEGELFVPEMLMAAQATKAGLQIVRPLLKGGESRDKGTIVMGTVKGDQHDIGKNLVVMMLEGAGFKVIDLGVDVSIDTFVGAAQRNAADVIGMSALLTTTLPAMEATVAAIRQRGLAVKTMVGGAPVTEAFARKIGAEGYGRDAPAAVEIVRSFLVARPLRIE